MSISGTSYPFHNHGKFIFKNEVFEERKKAGMCRFPSFRGKNKGVSKPQQKNTQQTYFPYLLLNNEGMLQETAISS